MDETEGFLKQSKFVPVGAEPQASENITKARNPLSLTFTIIVVVVGSVSAFSVARNQNFEWGVVADYLFDPRIMTGVRTTLLLTGICMVCGIVLSIGVALARISRNRLISILAAGFVWVFRGLPVLVQLFIWYNIGALYPRVIVGIPFTDIEFVNIDSNQIVTRMTAAIIGLTIYFVAYMTEIIRGGILSVNIGQSEAALALGMTPSRTMRRIVLPQALRSILPAAGNMVIQLLKYTSLVSVISVADLLYSAQLIYAVNFKVIPLLMVTCIWYLIIVGAMSIAQRQLEKRFARGHVRRH